MDVIIFTLGIIVGCVLTLTQLKKRNSGTVREEQVDEDGPYMFLELNTQPHNLKHLTYVVFKIEWSNRDPH